MKYNDFVNRSKEKFGDKFVYPDKDETFFVYSKGKVDIECKEHSKFSVTVYNHLKSLTGGCPICAAKSRISSSRISQEEFINRAKSIHGDRFDYSKTLYKGTDKKIIVYCPEHGEQEITAKKHLQLKGCKLCNISNKKVYNKVETEDELEKELSELLGGRYKYVSGFINASKNFIAFCDVHGEFKTSLNRLRVGQLCSECAAINRRQKRLDDKSKDIVERLSLVHPTLDFSEVKYIGAKVKVKVNCKLHGDFYATPTNLLSGCGCYKCGKISMSEKQSSNVESFIKSAQLVHGDEFDYSKVEYKRAIEKVTIICKKHREFEMSPNNHLKGEKCPSCAKNSTSRGEEEILEFLSTHTNVIKRDRSFGSEFDIYLPEEKVAIEFDGLYWHSELHKDRNYHLRKTELAKNNDIFLIHIFEDEWNEKKDIVKSRLLNIIGKTNYRIYARECNIKEVNVRDEKYFLNNNHLQGYCQSKICIGLYYKDELVQIMSFSNLRLNLGARQKEGCYELLRMCSRLNTSIIGGASKLINYFIKIYNPKKVISYADRRWSGGGVYLSIGMKFLSNTPIGYYWVKHIKRHNRFKFRKSVLVKMGYPKEKSESEIMREIGYYKIYDCGCLKFELDLTKEI